MILIVIADDHDRALRYAHVAIRDGQLSSPSSLIHVDAHPDLLIPQVSPSADPHSLQEFLARSPSGIAEWITPLIFQSLSSQVLWLKPAESGAIAEGSYDLRLHCNPEGMPRTDLAIPYFLREGLVCRDPFPVEQGTCRLLVKAVEDNSTSARASVRDLPSTVHLEWLQSIFGSERIQYAGRGTAEECRWALFEARRGQSTASRKRSRRPVASRVWWDVCVDAWGTANPQWDDECESDQGSDRYPGTREEKAAAKAGLEAAVSLVR